MGSLERFVEVPVVGALLLAGLLPVAIAFGWWPSTYRAISKGFVKRERLLLAFAIVFVAGVLGGRLVDDLYHSMGLDPRDSFRLHYENSIHRVRPDAPATLAAAELAVANCGEYSRQYVDRHHIFMRIDRAAGVGSLLGFMTTVFFWRRLPSTSARNVTVLVLPLLLWAFTFAFRSEASSYWSRVCVAATTSCQR